MHDCASLQPEMLQHVHKPVSRVHSSLLLWYLRQRSVALVKHAARILLHEQSELLGPTVDEPRCLEEDVVSTQLCERWNFSLLRRRPAATQSLVILPLFAGLMRA